MLSFDEARFGLINWHKKRYRRLGERPLYTVQRKYEWSWLYAAVEPATGESFCLYLPSLDGECFKVFLDQLSRTLPEHHLVLVMDNAPAHITRSLTLPGNISLLPLPPYSPELNPVERWFLEFRRRLANTCFTSIEALHDVLTEVLEGYWVAPDKLMQLTNFPWWHHAVEQL